MIRLKRSNVHNLAALAAVTAFVAALMAPQLPCHWLTLAVIVTHYYLPIRSAPFLLIALMPCITRHVGESVAVNGSVLVMTCSYALYFAALEMVYEHPHVSYRVTASAAGSANAAGAAVRVNPMCVNHAETSI
tara:strand:+ start:10 stop:408 length:399 start_codon:yes stop_codon:yes gene_type:complete